MEAQRRLASALHRESLCGISARSGQQLCAEKNNDIVNVPTAIVVLVELSSTLADHGFRFLSF